MAREVVMVIADLGAGGAQRVFVRLAESWLGCGCSVAVLTFASSDSDVFALPDGIRRQVLGGLKRSRGPVSATLANFGRILRLRKALRDLPAQTVVSFVGVTNVLTVFASIGLGRRVVVSERNDPSRQSLGRIWDGLRRLAYPLAGAVTVNSEGGYLHLREYVPAAKLFQVRNPRPNPPPEFGGPDYSAHTILTVGRLTQQKGIDTLFKAFSTVRTEYPNDWRIRVVGCGPDKVPLSDLADALGIAECIDWRGRKDQVWFEYGAASIFILASRFEGTSNAVLEAMAAGLPCIVSEAASNPLVDPDVNAIVVGSDDPDGLAHRLLTFMKSESKRQDIGTAAKKTIDRAKGDDVLGDWAPALRWPT